MDKKISQMDPITFAELQDDDVLPIVDQLDGETKKVSLFELDKRWKALPTGGTINQVLAKLTNVDGEVQWLTLSKSLLNLGQVNNTSDIDKPLSTAMIAALNDKATKVSVNAKADKSYVDAELLLKQNDLGVGTAGQVLTTSGGVIAWEDPGGDISPVKYFGDPTLDNSWRQRVDGSTFKTEVRIASAWVLVSELNIP